MSEPAEPIETIRVSPFEILLDPNSYRLIEDPLWKPVLDDEVSNPEVQRRTYEAILTIRGGIKDLVASMTEFGWLNLETLLVRRLTGGHLVVVDGNRRLAAWIRAFKRQGPQVNLFPKPAMASEVSVQIVERPSERSASLSLGIRHLLTTEPWPVLGTTLWKERHLNSHGEWPTPASSRRVRAWPVEVDSLALDFARKFKRSRWGSSYRTSIYSILGEALSNHQISAWLGAPGSMAYEERTDRLFSWMVPQGEDEIEVEGTPGETVSIRRQAVLTSPVEIRQLAQIVNHPVMLARLDAGESLDALTNERRSVILIDEPEVHLHPAVASRLARRIPIDSRRAQSAIAELRDALRRQGEEPVESGTDYPWDLVAPGETLFLKSLTLHRFRGLSDVSLADLGRVNLLVGVNNAGKTSVLEALYVLSRLSDPRGLFDTLRTRSRQDVERTPKRLADLVDGLEIDISASDLKGRKLGIQLKRPEPAEGTDVATHITDLRFEAMLGAVRFATLTSLFSDRRRVTRAVGPTRWLAPAVLHSPFWRHDRSAVVDWYKASFTEGTIPLILKTIQESVDDGIIDIRNVSEEVEFRVQHKNRRTMDLVNYGEGVQRVFEIGLLFAAHRGGLVLIDELETAVHTNALRGFTCMIHELAVQFDVQVFITTHSKETVDAFLFNEYRIDEVTSYILRKAEGGTIGIRRFGGANLKLAVEAGDVDLRRL